MLKSTYLFIFLLATCGDFSLFLCQQKKKPKILKYIERPKTLMNFNQPFLLKGNIVFN